MYFRLLGILLVWVVIGLVGVVGSFWGFSLGRSMGLSFSSGHGVPLFFFPFLLCCWGLRSSEPWGCLRIPLLLFISFFCEHWDISEH